MIERMKQIFQERKFFIVFLENLAFYAACIIIDFFFGDGTRWQEVAPHPFWLAILITSVKYGTLSGLMSATMATLFLYVGNFPPQMFHQTLFEHQWMVSFRPLLFFGVAYVLGELQVRVKIENQRLKKKIVEKEEHLNKMLQTYDGIKRVKEEQETLLASQQNTFATLYQSFRALESLKPSQIILNVDNVIQTVLSPKKLSVWALGEKGFEPVTCVRWEEGDSYVRRFSPKHVISQAFSKNPKPLCLVNESEATVLEGEGVMAAPLIDQESGEIFGMVKIEEMDFLDLTVTSVETFRILCELIGMAYTNARKFKRINQNTLFSEGQELGSYAYFLKLIEILTSVCERGNLPITLLRVSSPINYPEASLIRLQLIEVMKRAKESLFPPGAEMFVGKQNSKEWLILLPNVAAKDGESLSYSLLKAFDEGLTEPREPFKVQVEIIREQMKRKAEVAT